MNKTKLINLAANHNGLIGYCKKICNNRDIHNDLFQVFLISLFEDSEDKLIQKHNEGQFIGYCHIVLKYINLRRIKANKRINTKNELTELNYLHDTNSLNIVINDYDLELDHKLDRFEDFIVKNDCDILLKKNREITGISYNEIIYKKRLAKQLIKDNFI